MRLGRTIKEELRSIPREIYKLVAFLYVLSIALLVLHHYFNVATSKDQIHEIFSPIFNIHEENSIPTWYSTMLWAASSYLAAGISRQSEIKSMGLSRQWLFLSFIFLLASLDESASLHEKMGDLIIVINGEKLSGAFFYEWVVVGIPVAALVSAFFLPMALRAGLFTFTILSFSAALFLTGAVGLEMLQAAVHSAAITVPHWMSWRLGYAEELLEMVGVVTLIFGLLHLRAKAGVLNNCGRISSTSQSLIAGSSNKTI